MGIAAIQARLLALTSRQTNVGAEQQVINNKKTEIDRQQDELNKNTESKEELSYTEDKSIISKDAKELAEKYSDTKLEPEEKNENKTFEKEEKAVTQELTGYQKLIANNINKAYKTFAS